MADRNGDRYSFEESTSSSNHQPVYTSKQWAYQIDQNNGAYGSKQVIFDLSGFYNSQRFINPAEMIMVLPVVTTMTATSFGAPPGAFLPEDDGGLGCAPVTNNDFNVTDQFAMGYKSGNWHLIQSMQIQVDGKDVIQMTPNINYHASFVANTTWSESDLRKHSATTGFLPDTADSFKNRIDFPDDNGIGIVQQFTATGQ